MPIQLGGPSLPKPKKPKVLDPFGVPHIGSQVMPALGGAKPMGVALPQVTIPNANAYVQPNTISGSAQTSTDAYGNELTSDAMYGIGQKNYQDALAMGERTLLSDPINRLIQTYGYDPRTTAGLGDLASKYLDPTGLDAARAGGYTTSQQIERGFGQALAGVPTNLAETGMQRSGSSAILGNKLNYDRGLQDKNAIDQLLGGIGLANQNWTDFQTSQANSWRQAQEDIANRLSQQAGYHGEEDSGADDRAFVAAAQDYSGGPSSIYQPAPATAKLIQKMRASGQMSAWEKAMANINKTATLAPKINTKKFPIQVVR